MVLATGLDRSLDGRLGIGRGFVQLAPVQSLYPEGVTGLLRLNVAARVTLTVLCKSNGSHSQICHTLHMVLDRPIAITVRKS